MIPETFRAFYAEPVDNNIRGSFKELSTSVLPDHEVTIQVHYSSLNYKDALSATGKNHVTRNYPHIAGIDAAGVILEDKSGTFANGQKVIVTGQDLGTNTFGGFGELISVPKEWVVPLPDGLSLRSSMIYGTAGFTAIYGIKRLQRELITPESGKILVTGATGGVGSIAVFGLSQLGYHVIAASRKDDSGFLNELGASEIIHSDELLEVKNAPLLSRQWAGAIETVGGELLDSVLRQTQDKGAVACCGNILGKELNTNVYPFILRGVSLLGIDSAFCLYDLRLEIWETIASLDANLLPEGYYKVIGPKELPQEIESILKGGQKGRVVIEHDQKKSRI